MKKLTITVDDDVYNSLYTHIGRGYISRFINDMARNTLSTRPDSPIAGKNLLAHMTGKSTVQMTTDEIMALTRKG